jgi:ABC-type transport system involved in multi-copper enzyme maturation permease subunit
MTLRGVRLVLLQEFRMRVRTGRWQWLLGSWTAVVWIFTGLLYVVLEGDSYYNEPVGVPLFGGLMLFVLGLILLVSPAITAQSINGDRERGTLATLQATLLTPTDIVMGKLLAGWAVGLIALATTLPAVAWSVAEGVTVWRAIVTLAVVALLIGVVCAVSLGLSSMLPRSITSTLLSYVFVFALAVGTVIMFGLSSVMLSNRDGPTRDDLVWWMLAPNPFVVLADAAPQLPVQRDAKGEVIRQPDDPLGELGRGVRDIRRPPGYSCYDCYGYYSDDYRNSHPVWPFGLTFNLALGAGALVIARERLRAPADKLPQGTRIA